MVCVKHTLDADFAPHTFAWLAFHIFTILSYIADSIPRQACMIQSKSVIYLIKFYEILLHFSSLFLF